MASHRNNNFNIIRLLAALCVMAGHMANISGSYVQQVACMAVHTVGVNTLFIIGGYLIANSWKHDPHPLRYGIKRFIRLWPALAVFVLLYTYVAGPLLSELGPAGYFSSWYKAYLLNLRLYINYGSPGVFTHPGLPVQGAVNGSLWSLPVEAVAYVICPLVLSLCGLLRSEKRRNILLTVIAVLAMGVECARHYFIPGQQLVFYATDWAAGWTLITYFLIGMVYAIPQVQKWLNVQLGCCLLMLLFCVQFSAPVQSLCNMLVLPYFIFSFALAEKPIFAKFGTKYEMSYGIYLYGFFFQQLATWYLALELQLPMSYMKLFVCSLVPTLLFAWLSCVLVERPLIRLTNRLLGAWKSRERSEKLA